MTGTLVLDGRQVSYELTYKKVKYVNIRVRKDGTVAVSADRRVSRVQVETILRNKKDFILNALDRYAQMPSAPTHQTGENFWLLGRPYRLEVGKGPRNQVRLEGNRLLLTVKDPEDSDLRAKTMETFCREQCLELTTRLVQTFQPALAPLGVPVPEVKVRSMTSRWGSCTPAKKKVTFARQLIEAPLPCVEYVVWHELVHFVHPNHSADFYRVLSSVLPDWKVRRERLNSAPPFDEKKTGK